MCGLRDVSVGQPGFRGPACSSPVTGEGTAFSQSEWTRGNFRPSPRGYLAISRGILPWQLGRGVRSSQSGEGRGDWPEMPLNTLRCTGPLPVTTSYPAPNVSGVGFEVSGLRSRALEAAQGSWVPCTALRSEGALWACLLRSPATSQVCSAPLHTWVWALGHGRGGVPKGPRNSRVAQLWTPWLRPYS